MRTTVKKIAITVLLIIITTTTIAIAGISSSRLVQQKTLLDHPAMYQLAVYYKLGTSSS